MLYLYTNTEAAGLKVDNIAILLLQIYDFLIKWTKNHSPILLKKSLTWDAFW